MSTTASTQALAAPLMLVTTAHPNFTEHAGPNGEPVHPMLGRLIQPRHTSSIEATGAVGIPWAADNDCFQGLDAPAFEAMLDRIEGVPGCLFVTVPDVVGDAQATAELFDTWAPELERRGLPVALVLQDGVENLAWLDGVWDRLAAVFVGGTDEFKLGPAAAELAREAKSRGLWVHWGRVNSRKRIRHIAETGAADSFDGSPWATLRLAAVNQRTIDRAVAAGRTVPAAIRKLDQGLAWCLEVAREAAAQAPAAVALPDGRLVPAVAGGSPELDEPGDVGTDQESLDVEARAAAAPAPSPDAPELDNDAPEHVRMRLAEYHVLAEYDARRACRYGDMAETRRGRELNRRADDLRELGVPVDRTGHFPPSSPADLADAWVRVAAPRVRRLERETATVELAGGGTYNRRTRYNGTSLDTWREVERWVAKRAA